MQLRRYVPSIVPSRLEDLLSWLPRELRALAQGLNAVFDVEVSNKPPETAMKGMVRYASGAPGWDPGAGEGLYVYAGTPPAWVKLH